MKTSRSLAAKAVRRRSMGRRTLRTPAAVLIRIGKIARRVTMNSFAATPRPNHSTTSGMIGDQRRGVKRVDQPVGRRVEQAIAADRQPEGDADNRGDHEAEEQGLRLLRNAARSSPSQSCAPRRRAIARRKGHEERVDLAAEKFPGAEHHDDRGERTKAMLVCAGGGADLLDAASAAARRPDPRGRRVVGHAAWRVCMVIDTPNDASCDHCRRLRIRLPLGSNFLEQRDRRASRQFGPRMGERHVDDPLHPPWFRGQHHDAVRQIDRLVEVVGDKQRRLAGLGLNAQQLALRTSRVWASRALNGSSISRMAGSIARARARPMRCCMPPES